MTPHLTAIFTVYLLWNICLSMVLTDSDEKSRSDHEERTTTVHQRISSLSHIDFTDLDNSLGTLNAQNASNIVVRKLTQSLEDRLARLYTKATSSECRTKIATHFSYYINAIGKETPLPFTEVKIKNTCPEHVYTFNNLPSGMTIEQYMNRTYQPPKSETEYIDSPENLRLLYGILTHEHPESTIRLIEALYEEGHTFVVHVDGKETSDETYRNLVEYSRGRDYVHVLPDKYRCRVNWGGFSMVNATIQMLKYAFALNDDSEHEKPLLFHKFVHLSSTTYPIRSNSEIRKRIASYPLDANLVNVILNPSKPSYGAWHYFVECDDAVHRIYRFHPMTEEGNGMNQYMSSQWFIISREFAEYLAKAEKGTFVHEYLEYAEHIVVADEGFFGTVLRNTEFCAKHHNSNLLHYTFDRWENEVDATKRDPRKCVHPDPDFCGRSPALMTMDYLNVMDLSGDLFARKFSDEINSEIKNILDLKRTHESTIPRNTLPNLDQKYGILLVAKETVDSDMPLCLGLGSQSAKVKLMPCFHEMVVETLVSEWETGAVIEEEIVPNNRWEIGPCSLDGSLMRMNDGFIMMKPGLLSGRGPSCLLKLYDGNLGGRCLDIDSERVEPGGQLQVYPCLNKWHQTFSFGNDTLAPIGAIHASVPTHLVSAAHNKGKVISQQLCLGLLCRFSSKPELFGEDHDSIAKSLKFVPEEAINCKNRNVSLPLDFWRFKQVVTVPCEDISSTLQFVAVPFIKETEQVSVSHGMYENSDDDFFQDDEDYIEDDGDYIEDDEDYIEDDEDYIEDDEDSVEDDDHIDDSDDESSIDYEL